jgi:hypothetical protein
MRGDLRAYGGGDVALIELTCPHKEFQRSQNKGPEPALFRVSAIEMRCFRQYAKTGTSAMRIGSGIRAKPIATALVLVSVITLRCVAQVDKQVPSHEVEAPTAPFVGCYELALGRWWPWSFGEDTEFVTPPSRIDLLPEHGTQGFEQNGLCRAAEFESANGCPPLHSPDKCLLKEV